VVNHIPDATGWISENGPSVAPVIATHAVIASLAIYAIAFLIGQLALRSNRKMRPDDEDCD